MQRERESGDCGSERQPKKVLCDAVSRISRYNRSRCCESEKNGVTKIMKKGEKRCVYSLCKMTQVHTVNEAVRETVCG